MNEEARRARNEYMKRWRSENKDKVKEIQQKYWENKAKIKKRRTKDDNC